MCVSAPECVCECERVCVSARERDCVSGAGPAQVVSLSGKLGSLDSGVRPVLKEVQRRFT